MNNLELYALLNKKKQNKLTAGSGITIVDDVITATGGSVPMQGYYTSIQKEANYLYAVNYDFIDYDFAFKYFKEANNEEFPALCSSVRKGNLYGRNLDWLYNEAAEFVVTLNRTNDRFASIGMAGNLTSLTDNFVSSGDFSELYTIVPFTTKDGINEYGLVINTNVVPADFEPYEKTVPAISEMVELCSTMVPRYVLDHFKTAQSAANFLRDYTSIYLPQSLKEMNYDVHFMIADKINTFIVEIVDGIVQVIEGKNYMTNFNLYNVTPNEDGSVYTPVTQDETHDAIITNGITEHGTGLERYNYINSNYNNITDATSLRQIMQFMKYTNSYTWRIWYTEFTGGDLKVNSPMADFATAIAQAAEYYNNRSRDPEDEYYGTWQTVHTAIYNMEDLTLELNIQENYNAAFVYQIKANTDATFVRITEDITLTTDVGELPANTVVKAGTSVQDLFTQILSKSKAPVKTNPSVSAFVVKDKLSEKTSIEVGTYIMPKWDSTFSTGSYSYLSTPQKDPITPVSGTGVTAQNWLIKMDNTEIGTTEDGEMSSLVQVEDADIMFTSQVSYSNGNYALTNLKTLPESDVQILAGSTSKTAKIIHYRNGFFWGILTSSTEDEPITSEIIRAGTAKGSAYVAGNIGTLDDPIIKASLVPNCKRIFVACPASKTGLTKVIMPSAMGADATADFVKLNNTILVLGANEYTGIPYNVWVYEPASISEDQTFVVTLG